MTTDAHGGQQWTVGPLYGQPQGAPVSPATTAAEPSISPTELEGQWSVRDGRAAPARGGGFGGREVEPLDYSNPFGQSVERVWFDGKMVFAVDVGQVEVDPAKVKVAQEYEVVFSVELDEDGRSSSKEHVPGQFNIYDSVPGMNKYSPIWQFNYVVVPRSYVANTLRSEDDCLHSGYRIVRSNDFEN